jgi:hypothetical protein
MTKYLALTLLGTALIGLPALAQTTAPATNAPAATPPAATPPRTTTSNANRPLFEIKQGQWRSSKLVGLNVYSNDDDIGEINDLIVGQNGQIEAVVIGVGGFLGLGEHDVAVPFNQVKFMEEPRRVAAVRSTDGTVTRPANPAAGTIPPAATTNPPVASTNPPAADTTGTVTTAAPRADANRTATADTYRGYPDHAVVNMTKEQLRALPQVRYAR